MNESWPESIRSGFHSGIKYGVALLIIYGITECWFTVILPWIINPSYTYKPLSWGFTVLLFVIYPLAGMLAGGLFGACLIMVVKKNRFLQETSFPVMLQAILIMSLLLIYVLKFYIAYSFNLFLLFSAVCLLLCIASFLSALSDSWFERLRFMANPWTTCILLLGMPWMIKIFLDDRSVSVKITSLFSFMLSVGVLSFLIRKVHKKFDNNKSVFTVYSAHSSVRLVITSACILGIILFMDQAPYEAKANEISSNLESEKANVILITMDTVRADHMSLYGYERDTTPHLQELSKNATVYTHAIASSDMTLSTHASMFTGLYVRQHGAHYDLPSAPAGRPLDNKFDTLAEILSENGYKTMAVVANHGFLGHSFNLNQGFQYYDQRTPVQFLGCAQPFTLRNDVCNFMRLFSSPEQYDKYTRSAEEINKEVFRLFGKTERNNNRFFLFINYMDPHWPYIPPEPFDRLYPGKIEHFTMKRYFELVKDVMRDEDNISEKERNHMLSQYDGEIAYLDYNIMKLIERLKELDLYENSLIIITSDHGEAFGEKNLLGHGVSVYQDQVYVPLIIKYPHSNNGHVVNDIVTSIDIMPTIMDVLGFVKPEYMLGWSLVKDEPGNSRDIVSESFPRGMLSSWNPKFSRVARALFSGQYKFISSTVGKRELYNLGSDPDERENLYKSDERISMELEERLNNWLITVKAESSSPAKLDKSAIDRLKTLGYVN